ncbi:glycosyltransferase family 4 protein [Terricaulis silvestris]|nr:glycosyltransferase family 4 protein [Terricaulis silvestris]
MTVYFAHKATPQQQAAAGFGTAFEWDVDILTGYAHEFLRNAALDPGTHHFLGCDTPGIGARLREGNFDALLVTGWNLKSYWQGILAAKRRGVPILVRGDSQLETPRAAVTLAVKSIAYPPLLRLFDAALYVGQRNLAYWRRYHYPVQRLFFSPHCVDNFYFASRATQHSRNTLRARLGIANLTPVALFAGKLLAFKRPQDLVSAAAQVRSQGADLNVVFAGSGEQEGQLRAQAQQLGVPAHFIGFQNQSEMPAAYAASDVLVLPSSGEETWGLVANEALACARPIIVTEACGCAPDLAGDGTTGRVVPVKSPNALSAALQHILGAPPAHETIATKIALYSPEAAAAGVKDAALAVLRKDAPQS